MSNFMTLTATAQVKVGAGKLKGIIVASGTAPTVAVYDTPNGGTLDTILPTMTFASTPFNLPTPGDEQGLYFSDGLYIVLGGTNPKVTVIFD